MDVPVAVLPAMAAGCEVEVLVAPRENRGAEVPVDTAGCEAGAVGLGPKLKPPVAGA